MRFRPTWLHAILLAAAALPAQLSAQTEPGPFARIAILRVHDGEQAQFEEGYLRHLAWHRGANDTFRWYGYTIWSGERARLFVYASFNHSAASLANAVSPAEDERDNVVHVAPWVEWQNNWLYEFLPSASRGTAAPTPMSRLELVTVTLRPGSERAFEAALTAAQPAMRSETLWYRRVTGGITPTYIRLRPRANLEALLDGRTEQALPAGVANLIQSTDVQVWVFRPTMSLGVAPAAP